MSPAPSSRTAENPSAAAQRLAELGFTNPWQAHAHWTGLTKTGAGAAVLDQWRIEMEKVSPRLGDPDQALAALDRLATAGPEQLQAACGREPSWIGSLLVLLDASPFLAGVLAGEGDLISYLTQTEGSPLAREAVLSEAAGFLSGASDERAVLAGLRRFRRRELLRIAWGDLVRRQSVETVTRQLSHLADALVSCAAAAAEQKLRERWGEAKRAGGRPGRFSVLALGKLGGCELNYSSDIDLIFLYDAQGQTSGARSVAVAEYYERLAKETVKLLSAVTEDGQCYRVDLRLRPFGQSGPLAVGLESGLAYYDAHGRTWERQALVKGRTAAGDAELGEEFLAQLSPWIYRRYLNRADIAGIKALKRRIEQRARREGDDHRNVKTGRGGIRDVEFVIQFLQLLNGGDLRAIRCGGTLSALAALAQAGCLTMQEQSLLAENYAALRRIEHQLQLAYDRREHSLPEDEQALHCLAVRLGFAVSGNRAGAREAFLADYQQRTDVNRKILDHLLHDAFGEEDETDPEVDLVLDPEPPPDEIERVLVPYGFRDLPLAYRNLMDLSRENIEFLSTRRCRHFLAAIAPRLLGTIASTPDPDGTLINLARVSDSLGGKGVLWELFSFNPPSMRLYVKLCAASPYLSSILISHPGMIDELMDSLVLNRLPQAEELDQTLAEWCRSAEDVEPALSSFKSAQHLRVGVRELLGKESIDHTLEALANIADACVRQIALASYWRVAEQFGEPMIESPNQAGRPCELVIVALGKLGGREPNYHSDLDLVFLYEGEGQTQHQNRRGESTTNQHFFSQWAQRVVRALSQQGPSGRLYDVDSRLRPGGRSGVLVQSLGELRAYFDSGQGQLWERQALCKARPIFGSPAACAAAKATIRSLIAEIPWQDSHADEIYRMRLRLQETASPANIKRGAGGTMDIEFAVQMLQLQHARRYGEVLVPGTLPALEALQKRNLLAGGDVEYFARAYRFLRSVESALRLLNTVARHDLPGEEAELQKLAYLLRWEGPARLLEDVDEFRQGIRSRFERLFGR